jgi:hypothetical protein
MPQLQLDPFVSPKNAIRISPWFDLAENIDDVIRICQLSMVYPGDYPGIFLGQVYTCKHIAQEISKNIDFLTTSAPDIPLRQRSLKVVFDNSWRLCQKTSVIFSGAFPSSPHHFLPRS